MSNTCDCGKPTRDAAFVCEQCLTDLSKALGEVPWTDGELEITITRQKGAATGGGAPSMERPLPYNLAASDARIALRQALFTWIRFCTEEHVRNQASTQDWPADNLPAMSRWLMWRVDGLGFSDLGSDAVTEITSAVANCQRMIDRPPERRYTGPCECGRDLYHQPGAHEAKCRECGRTYDVAELREWMSSQVRGRLVTAREGSTLLSRFGLETKQGTVDTWHQRGLLFEKGHDTAQRRLYLFDDLLELANRHAPRVA